MPPRTTDAAERTVRGLADSQRRAQRNGQLTVPTLEPDRGRAGRRAQQRGRSVRRFSAVAVVALALGAPLALDPSSIADDRSTEPVVTSAAEAAEDEDGTDVLAAAQEPVGPTVFARFEDLELALPAQGVRLVAYHEAAFADALSLEPAGRKVLNDNPTKFTDPGASDGPEYAILNARDRRTSATSAVDIALDPGTPITSLVTGVVTDVERYHLYGRHVDHRVEIAPAGREDLRVVIIHVEEPAVAIGDEVVAGETTLAPAAVLFPFESQIDRYVGSPRGPHIHVEVKRNG